jgi:hypothetical protein
MLACTTLVGEVPVMTGPQDPAAGGADRLRVGHADLAALTADIPAIAPAPAPAPAATLTPVPAAAGLARPSTGALSPTQARRWPLARASAQAGGCLGLAVGLILFAANVLDPHGLGNPYHPWRRLCAVVALGLVLTALGIFAMGVSTSAEQRRSRKQLPPGAAHPI